MNAKRITILAAVAVAGSAYFIFFKDRHDFVWLFAVSLIIMTLAYVFQYQIDQLMIRGIPQKLDPAMRQMLLNTAPHFKRMTDLQRQLIEDRMKRWVQKKDFINKNEKDAPEDVKYILAYDAILLTIHQEEYLYDGLDRIVFYHHPFLTPSHMDDAHILEVEPVDGTIIISVPHLLRGHFEKGFYNLGLHAVAQAYYHCYVKDPVEWPDDIWEILESISSISKSKIEAYIGLPLDNPWPVAVHHQLTYGNASIPEVLMLLPQFNLAEK